MANDTIIRVTADTTGYTSAIERARRAGDIFLSSQEVAAKRMQLMQAVTAESVANGSDASIRKTNMFLQSLIKEADTAGKTRVELLQMQTAHLDAASAAQDYIKKTADASGSSQNFGLKIAGARKELLALADSAQQGNWLNFGSSLIDLGEKMGVMTAVMSPVGLAIGGVAAGIGVVAMAAVEGAAEQSKMNEALTMTGDYAGVTSGQLRNLALDATATGGSIDVAKEALIQLASSGKFTSDQIGLIAGAATNMEEMTGQAVGVTIGQFSKLADEPAQASIKLNEQYHYLTLSVYEQIAALEEQGNKQAAANLAEETYASAMNARTGKLRDNLGSIGRGWLEVKEGAAQAWDAILGIGRKQTPEDSIRKILGNYQYTLTNNPGLADSEAGKRYRDSTIAQLTPYYSEKQAADKQAQAESEKQQAEAKKIAAKGRIENYNKEFSDPSEKRKKEVDEYTNSANTLGISEKEQAGIIAKINGKYKTGSSIQPRIAQSVSSQPKESQDDAARFLQQLRDQDAATRASLESGNRLIGAEKQQADFLQKIEGFKKKPTLTADEKSLQEKQDQIKLQLEENVLSEKKLKNVQEIQKIQERSAQINAQIASFQQGQSEQHQAELDAVSMGAEAQKRNGAVKSINKEYEKQQQQLDSATPEDKRNSSEYLDQKETIQGQLQQSLKEYDKYYANLKEKQGDWRNGAMKAFYDYQDTASNVAAQAGAVFTNAAKGMEDALFNFAMTGKLSFTDMAKSIIADIARMQARAAVSGLFNMAISAIGSYFGGASTSQVGGSGPGPTSFGVEPGNNFTGLGSGFYGISGKASGGLVTGPGTSTSDSVATKLSNGEFVNNAESTKKNRGILEWMNSGGDSSKLGPGEPGVASAGRANAMANVGAAAGAAVNVVTNITISDAGTSSETKGDSGAVGKQIGAMIEQTLKGLLVKELRDGGILSKTRMGYA